jgi:hypothetical protein
MLPMPYGLAPNAYQCGPAIGGRATAANCLDGSSFSMR